MPNEFEGKTILVTGGTGSIGSTLVEKLLAGKPRQVRVLSRDETKQYELREQLNNPSNLRLLIGDIRDQERLDLALAGVDVVFHAAALKHVPLCEYNPTEAVKTNVIGSQNVVEAAIRNNVKTVVAISTDKAVNPIGIMGTTKLLMEKLVVNANYCHGAIQTRLCCVRFGNVAWARGSVLPLWQKQVERDHCLTLTNPDMTRFIMSKNQATDLILEAANLTHGGEIFIFKMPAITLGDLAKLFIEKYYPNQNVETKILGNREGEKLDEILLDPANSNEDVLESQSTYAVIPRLPIYDLKSLLPKYPGFQTNANPQTYSSRHALDPKSIQAII